MIVPTCWKLGTAAAILLSSIGVQAVYFDPQQNEYDAYCSAHASPAVGAICFDTSFDIRQHIVSSSPELVGFLSKDLRSFALPVGTSGSTMYFTTLFHRVDMVALDYRGWSQYPCVQYTISSTKGRKDSRVGHFCPGDRHVVL
ncbi:uncharacterized protein UMAG_12258 [Mycosarcoma maydis]|uniref:Uncharacterized protein n=1 Tax=Mycosarcoma maydis TaxID=5270 RepID=A0A0D1DYX8_MYCMD|nr:uncharacterized protein UMAG_12258 [Ustilago maydis 521]KIS67760.1 hypothetical protein UMAG_12258 [Ustilago maydis 521]|eukprot:XP_011390820.1 hypothetical protein UMAG_12258 [Ustilago maydis 521]